MSPRRLRVLTYNVHRCIGRDGKLSPARIAAAIAEQRPDLVALQELDVGCARTGYADQVRLIGEALEMKWFFHPAMRTENEHFGDALLSRFPMRLIRAASLPTLAGYPHLERRGALWAEVDFHGTPIQFLTTHLGLYNRERIAQAEALVGEEWLGDPHCKPPLILCGDLNAIPGTRAYRRLKTLLRDPFPWGSWPIGTFPAACPILRIDHAMMSRDWTVHKVRVPRTRLTRIASDHLPLLVEASVGSCLMDEEAGSGGEKLAEALAL